MFSYKTTLLFPHPIEIISKSPSLSISFNKLFAIVDEAVLAVGLSVEEFEELQKEMVRVRWTPENQQKFLGKYIPKAGLVFDELVKRGFTRSDLTK